MQIIAHRGNTNGPDAARENTVDACAAALGLGLGVEIDLRRDVWGTWYLSHDAAEATMANGLASVCPWFRRYAHAPVAVNVKQLGNESELVALYVRGKFGQESFFFDFELLEPHRPGATQRKIRALPQGRAVRLAARASDRGESLEQCLAIPADVVWVDEWDCFWLTAAHVRRMQAAGRRVIAVSPELHGQPRRVRLRRWAAFRAMDLDGICTDYGEEALAFFRK